ncbi:MULTISPECIES: GntR family transcriptional regulator [Micrococcaceae]|uniref:GntR family transcriptional regulator n=2 Tax=Micrococcales TaxID=85006 RepID=UPI000CFB2C46|nr:MULTISPECIES: GntR family transcriptional regulator [unclassified Arthrobacter]PQZ90477.1 GntR family transcriptional regulator [Arthrobacter sp. MYb222]PRB75945.1 GntR family transcriptional regulator [Arthrobacter sp. MYb214]TDU26148.1 DNA-binding GntR family transcriptional regulator [Arthrobacter sp. JUb115]
MQESSSVESKTRSTPETPLLGRLRQMIVTGVVQPGDLLAETALAQDFEVSRTPIREALKQLEREGLVEVRSRVGTFVRKPTQREIHEMFSLKEAFEGLAAGLLARRGAVPELEQLKENVARSQRAVERGDAELYSQLVHEFHSTLVAGADNRKLTEHYDLLMNQLAYHRIVSQTLSLPGRLQNSKDEHQAIIDAISSKDPLAAELVMRRHVAASSQSAALAAMKEEDEEQPG